MKFLLAVLLAAASTAAGQSPHQGDRIATGPKERVTIQLDSVNEFEAAPNTEVRVVESDEYHHLLHLTRGSLLWRVHGPSSADVAIETPNVTVRPSQPGEYILSLNVGLSEITARRGAIEVFAPQGSEWVYAGRKLWARGPASAPEFRTGYALAGWRRALTAFSNLMQIAGAFGGGGGGSSSDSTPSTQDSGSAAKPSAAQPESARPGTASHTSGPAPHVSPPSTGRK
jgi:ferric-dicitrate binding protein FerR (iron transport regulator)